MMLSLSSCQNCIILFIFHRVSQRIFFFANFSWFFTIFLIDMKPGKIFTQNKSWLQITKCQFAAFITKESSYFPQIATLGCQLPIAVGKYHNFRNYCNDLHNLGGCLWGGPALNWAHRRQTLMLLKEKCHSRILKLTVMLRTNTTLIKTVAQY